MKTIYNKLMGLIFSPSTPIQLLLVSVLGFIFGFIPGFAYAPLLSVLTILLVLILRVNIGLFVLIAFLAKVLSFPLESINFTLGTWLLDGFTQPIFKAAVNTPVLAYAGFDYYLVTGAFVLSLVLGLGFGIFFAKSYKKFVDKMASIQAGSELYQKLTSKLIVKIGLRIVFGKNIAKVNWEKIQARKFHQPIRIWGLIVVIACLLAVVFSLKIIETAMVSDIIKQQLTKVNGATVDYDSMNLNLGDAKLEINGLGAADPENLDKDRFYAKSISASMDIRGLLTKQIALKNVIVDGVSLYKERQSKGTLYATKIVESINDGTAMPEEVTKKTLDKVKEVGANIKQENVTKIKEAFEKTLHASKSIKKIVTNLSDFMYIKPTSDPEAVSKKNKAQAKIYGYANIRNESLRDEIPNFVIQNINIKSFKSDSIKYDANITNLSTNPALLSKPTQIHIQSTSNKDVDFDLVMSNQDGIENTIKLNLENLEGDFLKGLTIQGVGIDADSVNVSGTGTWNFSDVNNVAFNIPLQLKLSNIGINLSKVKQKISDLTLKATLSGDLNNVDLAIDTSNLKNILSVETVKNAASGIVKQTGLDKHAEELINKTTINGKSVKDLNAKDVKDLASKFGVSF
ncbi:MAG: hypothetical protein ACI8TE_001369 [Francisella sp.]